MVKILLGILLYSSVFASTIKVAIAANLAYAITPLKEAFLQKHPDAHIDIIQGSSGKLSAQIQHGAPYALFLSADTKYPMHLYHDKHSKEAPIVYAKGQLVLFSRHKRDFSSSIMILKNPDIQRIAIANPKTAPYGKAAKEALTNAKLYDTLQNKFVYGESIAQTLTYTLRATDIGIIAKSALYTPAMQSYTQDAHWIALDTSLYTPIKQSMILLCEDKTAQDFYQFLQSPQAKEILHTYGYDTP